MFDWMSPQDAANQLLASLGQSAIIYVGCNAAGNRTKCLDLYRKEVDVAKLCRAQIQQEIADYVAEIAGVCAAMGEQPLHFDPKACGSLKKARETVVSQLEEMRKLKTDRKKHFSEVLYQLKNISSELYGSMVANAYSDETNLSLKRLEELQKQLLQLQNEKTKEEALSRKEILEKVEKWLVACQEESWLEEYNRSRLLSMLEDYSTSRQEKENERQRQRDQKKLQGQ
ncbi:hypothetical protein JHK82_051289 [Glycine max]|nr:hypothetical protein JHK82_051289 [Glycine max]